MTQRLNWIGSALRCSGWLARLVLVLGLVATAAACSGEEPPAGKDAVGPGSDGAVDAADNDAGCDAGSCTCQQDSDCGSGVCLLGRDGDRSCAVSCTTDEQCQAGGRCTLVGSQRVCRDPALFWCDPCSADVDCYAPGSLGAACLTWQGEQRCGVACATDTDCPAGAACQLVATVSGNSKLQCVPVVDGSPAQCSCSARASQLGLAMPCLSGLACTGQRTCSSTGLSACDAPQASVEVCNGVDDDCNGATDEGPLCTDGNPCTPDQCDGAAGCSSLDPVVACDDDNPCTIDSCDPALGCQNKEEANCVALLPYTQDFSCAVSPPLFLSDPQLGQPRWGLDALPGLGLGAPGYHSAGCSLNLNLHTGFGCATPGQPASASATTPWLDASAVPDLHHLSAEFWLAGDWPAVDVVALYGQAEAGDGGQPGPWLELAQLSSPGGAWQRVRVDLPAFAGGVFRLQWRWTTASCGLSPNLPGVYLDDLSVANRLCKAAQDCDDDDPCTTNSCATALSRCVYTPASGAACDDGSPCTLSDTCKSGQCKGSPASKLPCDDANLCTALDTCLAGQCKGSPITIPCSDGNLCTSADLCQDGQCLGVPKTCPDNDPCTASVCDIASGSCGAVPDGEGNSCSGGLCANAAACHLGSCRSFGGCDDNNPCTSDSCSGGGSCSFAPLGAGSACVDGLACTTGDTCVAGQCQGQVAACGPAAAAPMVCDLPLGASWTTTAVAVDGTAWQVGPSPAVVTSGLTAGAANATNQSCALRFAGPAGQLACPATDDGPGAVGSATWRLDLTGAQSAVLTLWSHASFGGAKQPVSRWIDVSSDGFVSVAVSHGWAPGVASGAWEPVSLDLSALVGQVVDVRFRLDASLCQSGGLLIPMGSGWAVRDLVVTTGGSGPSCTSPAHCDDNNPCTTDLCLPSGACSYASTGAVCEDGSLCTQGDACTEQGQCHGSIQLACKDDSACTADTCDPASGCVFTPLPGGAACNDGDVCTSGDICLSGLCLTKNACDDGNPCTTDTCEPDGDCTQVALPAGTACSDGDPCTVDEQCVVGQCSGSPVPCSAVVAMDLPCNATGWSLGLASGSGPGWQLDNSPVVPTAHSGTCTLHLHDNDGIGCAPGTTLAASATSPSIVVPSTPASVLELWSWADVGVTLQKNARLIEVSTDGFATVAVRRWLDNGKFPRSWQRVRLDLAALAGQTVQVRLRFDAMACQGDIGLGWLVDDLRLVAAVAQPCADLADCQPVDACVQVRCRAGACEYMPATTGCDDGNLCTIADTCAQGQCSGLAKFCDDGLPCTLDTCDAVDGCVAGIRPNGALCDDKNSCTSATTCQNGNCLGLVAPDNTPCASATPCVESQVCTQGQCVGGKPSQVGSGCDDTNPCTPPGTCGKTGCVWPAEGCDDGESCTLDSCHPLGGSDSACQHLVLPLATPCDDGDSCTPQDTCALGGCDGAVTAQGCFVQFGSDFDDCQWPADWTATPPVLGVGWGIDGLPAWPGSRSGNCSLNFNNNKDFSAGNSVAGEVALPPIAVPLLGEPDLVLWSWHAGWLEDGVDKRSVLIRTAPTGPVALELPLANASRPGQWQRIRLSLLAFVGKALWIRLRMDSVTAIENAAPGWFVDDLRVQVKQPADCKKDADCAAPQEPCQVTSCQAGVCVAKVLTGSCDDGQICTEGDDCGSGTCQGTAVNCDDGYACTVDTCQNPTGCQHAVLADCGIIAVPYTEPFDCNSSGPTYWLRQVQTQNQGLGGPQWQVDASPAAPGYASASCSLNFNNGQNFTCPDGASSVGGTATTPVLNASAIAPGKLLRVRFKLAGTWDVGTADDVLLEVKPLAGQTWQPLGSWDPAPGWRTLTVDLGAYAGTSFQLRFVLATADCGSNAGSGPFVDDFQVFGGNCTNDAACEDGNSCTIDSCQLATGLCSAQAVSGVCDDGNACTVNDACSAGDCAGAAVTCNDNNPCTDDACSPVSGTCQNAAKIDGASCNDNLHCTTGDTCSAGSCSGTSKPAGTPCQDGNSCTTGDQCIGQACSGTGVAVPGSLCSDGDPCTAGENCNGAVCDGAQPACDDSDPCTLDQCTAVGPLSKTCSYQPIAGCQP